MEGADRVLLIASSEFRQRMQQHQNAMMRDYLATEALIRHSGVPAVIFRNALYLDTLPVSLSGPAVFKTGIRVPAGHGAVAYALRREMGEATANAMLDHSDGDRTYVLAAPRAYTFDDVARALSEISGPTVIYASVSDDDFVARAVEQGIPEQAARHLAGFFADVRDHHLDETSTDLQALLGRAPASLKDGLAELFTPPASA
jgi:NAD(P)H dehydrogenase (quinone)